MRSVSTVLFGVLVLMMTAPQALADHDGHRWLKKMSVAARTLSYEGEFVYQHGMQLESMRIVHRIRDGKVRERIVSLNGAPREILRDNDEVRCYLPDEKSVMVSHRNALGKEKRFPAILPDDLSMLENNYAIELGSTERVTRRAAQVLHVKPKDHYRYGYVMWADRETGLLLKAALMDMDGKLLEQFMFTSVRIGGNIPDSALAPGIADDKDMVWHHAVQRPPSSKDRSAWIIRGAPKGFIVRLAVSRDGNGGTRPMTHLVLSDGLAAVSVFIEKTAAAGSQEAMSHMGAVHAHQSRIGEFLVTVVGEVPAETVKTIAGGVTRQN